MDAEPSTSGTMPLAQDALHGRIARLEEAAARAIPAREQVDADGWRLRADDGGFVGRANSALAMEQGRRPLQQKIDEMVDWYRGRGRRPRLQLTPVSRPDGLAEALAAGGWRRHTPVRIMTAEVGALRARCRERLGPAAGRGVRANPVPDGAWLATYASGLAAEQVQARTRLAAAAPAPKAYLDAQGSACALVVQDRELVGLFDVSTRPEARRQGLASHLLAAAADWAEAQGARTLYLQVAEGNGPAERLYLGMGFEPAYGYAYMELPA